MNNGRPFRALTPLKNSIVTVFISWTRAQRFGLAGSWKKER